MFTTYCCSGAKKQKNNAFSWAKNTARGVRFLLGFNMYMFLAQCEQLYHFLAPSHNSSFFLPFCVTIRVNRPKNTPKIIPGTTYR